MKDNNKNINSKDALKDDVEKSIDERKNIIKALKKILTVVEETDGTDDNKLK